MQKLYLEYPEISEIKANIVSRRNQDDNTQIILDRTIFMPKSSYLLEDKGTISNLEVLSVDEKRDNIIHLIKGKTEKSEVILKLDRGTRNKNLAYNTALIIFKIVMQALYNFKDIKLYLNDERGLLKITDLYENFNQDLVESQVNDLINMSLDIEDKQGIISIYPIGEVINNDICYNNTAKVGGFKILNTKSKGLDLEIEFISGSDLVR